MAAVIALALIALIAAGCWLWLSIALDGPDHRNEPDLTALRRGAGQDERAQRQGEGA